jgi:hypothetical protein
MDERTIDEAQVRDEHLKAVNQGAQALYIIGVIGGSFVLMVLLIALLGASSGG